MEISASRRFPRFSSPTFSAAEDATLFLHCERMGFFSGFDKDAYLFQAAAYLWRLGAKGDVVEDLGKALWYLTERRRMVFANDWPLPDGVAIHEAIVFIEQARSRYSDDVVTT